MQDPSRALTPILQVLPDTSQILILTIPAQPLLSLGVSRLWSKRTVATHPNGTCRRLELPTLKVAIGMLAIRTERKCQAWWVSISWMKLHSAPRFCSCITQSTACLLLTRVGQTPRTTPGGHSRILSRNDTASGLNGQISKVWLGMLFSTEAVGIPPHIWICELWQKHFGEG